MAKHLLILGGADLDKRNGSSSYAPILLERFTAWVRELHEKGQFVSSYKLYDQTGRRLTIRGGEVIDGPFIESKDAVGGVIIIETSSLDEATEVARRCPVLELQHGFVEVRVVEIARPSPQ